MVILPARVEQESSAKITFNLKNVDDGSAVTPTTLTWTLTDLSGNVINSRLNVSVSTPTSSEDIWLSGDDLALTDETKEYELRKILINVTYNNGTSTVPLKEEGQFAVYNLAGVS